MGTTSASARHDMARNFRFSDARLAATINRLNGPTPPVHPAGQDTVRFAARQPVTESQRRVVVEEALRRIQVLQASGRPLQASDQVWLDKLQTATEVSAEDTPKKTILHPDDLSRHVALDGRLTTARINQNRERLLSSLSETLQAMRFATDYQPVRRNFGAYSLAVHNPEIAGLLQPRYTVQSFQSLLNRCEAKGTFDVQMDPQTGLIKTAEIDESEDHIMVQGWFTDTIRNGDLQKFKAPALWRKALETLARVYENERPVFDAIIHDPQLYTTGGRDVGVTHIFSPVDFKRFDWLSKKRLESHGLTLKAMCDTIVDGLAGQKPWGYATADAVDDRILQSIVYLAKYFAVINYPEAPTNGAWEEVVFNGLTSDVEAMRSGLESLQNLMFNPALDGNPGIQIIRQKLRETVFGQELLQAPQPLQQLIALGQQKLEARLASGQPIEHPERPADAALAFVTTSTLRLSDDPIQDILWHQKILETLEQTVVRENGLIRYPSFNIRLADGRTVETYDGYLTPNWGLSADGQGRISLFKEEFSRKFGYPIVHIEPSTTDHFHVRGTYAGMPNQIAEWFMIAEMAKGYGLQLRKMLDVLDQKQQQQPFYRLSEQEQALLRSLYGKTVEYINRSYARITGENMLKANGKPCPAWKIPEAYQHVSTFRDVPGRDGPEHQRETTMLPGVNTPLAWGTSALYSASQVFADDLSRLEAKGLLPNSNP